MAAFSFNWPSRRTHLSSLVATGLILCIGVSHAAEGERNTKAAELEKLRQHIEVLRSEVDATQNSRRDVRNDLASIERKISAQARRLRATKERIRENTGQLQTLQAQKTRMESAVAQQRELLARQMRAAYVAGHQDYLKLALNQEQPAAVGRTLTYYSYIHQTRRAQIDDIERHLAEIAVLQRDIEEKNLALTTLQASLTQDQVALALLERDRRTTLNNLDLQLHDKNEQLARMQSDERQLQDLLRRLHKELSDIPPETGSRTAFARMKGKLPWPVAGRITTPYGAPRAAGQLSWQGVTLQAHEGEDVRAVAHGRVAYADWLQGFGMVIIIDHGDGYMSLYAYNQSLAKEVGDWTEAGEVIATAGNSGGRKNASLYFEIRYNGQPTNPTLWCKR